MKKLYGNPEINIKYFKSEYIRTAEGEPVPAAVAVSGNYHEANNWLREQLVKNNAEVINIISFN